MAENKTSLFPVFDVPATLAEDIENEERYAPAPLWDVERGDFVTDGANRTLYGSGYDAWVLWCTQIHSDAEVGAHFLQRRYRHRG